MQTLMLSFAAATLLFACAPIDGAGVPSTPPSGTVSQCKADQYQRFVGRNRTELPPKPSSETWRVTCTTCLVTLDYSQSRLNIVFDERTGIIREVKCG